MSARLRVRAPSAKRGWMKRLLIAAVVAGLLALPGLGGALPNGVEVSNFKGGLNFPVDMAWVKGSKRIFFTEKNSGRIRIIDRGNLRSRPCADLSVNSNGERGLLGITLHPNYKENHWLYVYYANASPLENRVTRFTVENGRCRNSKHVVKGISAASSGYHNGGQLEFVGRKLFVSTGERHQPGLAQQTGNRLGKILRYNPDGSIPKGNPFSGGGDRNPVWTYGHRNPFGLAHKPGSRRIFSTENGPQCDDELNVIKKGRNYGWGNGYDCGTAGVGPNPKGPLRRWSNIIVPTDPWFYKGRIRRLSGNLFVGDYSSGRLHKFNLNAKGTRIQNHSIAFNNPDGILDVSKGPGGWLYFLTNHSIKRVHN